MNTFKDFLNERAAHTFDSLVLSEEADDLEGRKTDLFRHAEKYLQGIHHAAGGKTVVNHHHPDLNKIWTTVIDSHNRAKKAGHNIGDSAALASFAREVHALRASKVKRIGDFQNGPAATLGPAH